MKTNILLAILILSLAFLAGCFRSQETDPNIPQALQETNSKGFRNLDYSRSKGRNDLVDDLFDELSESRPELQRVKEKQLRLIVEMEKARSELFAKDFKSSQYYNDARAHAQSIQDSSYAEQLRKRIEASYSTWHSKLERRDAVAEELALKRQLLIDELHALKVRITLPVIEDYQQKTMPSTDSAATLLRQQDGLLKEMKQL